MVMTGGCERDGCEVHVLWEVWNLFLIVEELLPREYCVLGDSLKLPPSLIRGVSEGYNMDDHSSRHKL